MNLNFIKDYPIIFAYWYEILLLLKNNYKN